MQLSAAATLGVYLGDIPRTDVSAGVSLVERRTCPRSSDLRPPCSAARHRGHGLRGLPAARPGLLLLLFPRPPLLLLVGDLSRWFIEALEVSGVSALTLLGDEALSY